jgi:hypothetical protein
MLGWELLSMSQGQNWRIKTNWRGLEARAVIQV